MINLIQPITIQQAYDGITHARQWVSWNWWWRKVDDDGNRFPSSEPRPVSRSALLREIRAWRWLRIVKCDDFFSLVFSPRKPIYGVGVGVGGPPGGPWGRGRAPHPREQGVGPLVFIFGEDFLLIFLRCSVEFQVIPRMFAPAHK